jgi:NAD(P)-dependent dehydrogenase (short-subunit alcohol dehydrogenase family)
MAPAWQDHDMEIRGCVVVVTGGGGGIGAGMSRTFAQQGAAAVAVADIDEAAALRVAAEVENTGARSLGMRVDAGDEADVQALVDRVESRLGPIDLFCANAGIMVAGGIDVSDDAWDRIWRVNVKSHIYAARAVVPRMLDRGSGYLLHTASAAGLLTQLGAAPYSVTKHAVVAFAEWLSITYGDRGIAVSCLCPQAVETAMTGPMSRLGKDRPIGAGTAASDGMLAPADVAQTVVAALAEERFLVLPHPQVATYEKRRADDRDRWLRGMRRAQAAIGDALRQSGRA